MARLHHPSPPDTPVSPPGTTSNIIDSVPPINPDQLQILYTNADQFINKRDDLVALIAGNEPDLILITEITPKARCTSISKCLLEIPGFSTFFNFDSDSSSNMDNIRGVGIYVSNSLHASEAHFYDSTFMIQLLSSMSGLLSNFVAVIHLLLGAFIVVLPAV